MAKQNKSWEDQLSSIYKDMTGIEVDYAKQKETERNKKRENRFSRGFREKNGIVLNEKNKTNADRPGYKEMQLCYVTLAVVPIDFEPDSHRLDAPCDICVNRQCPYSQGEIK